MNLMDVPPPARARIQVATVRTAFAESDVAMFGEVPVLRGRRAGNVILLAGNVPVIKPDKHESVLRGIDLGNFTGGARPLQDEAC